MLPRPSHPDLLVGTETHDDAGVFRLRADLALVQTVDFFPPVVDDPFIFGQIAAANALSDIYAMGGSPLTALNLVAYPDNELGPEWLQAILRGGAERCQAAGCVIVGGHSIRDAEIKYGLAVTGTIHPERILTNAAARPGDVLVLTKPLGTGLVATAAKKQICPERLLQSACASMTQLNAVGRDAMLAAGAHAATDITGFGLAGHALEMAQGSGVTLVLRAAALPTFDDLGALDLAKCRSRGSKSNREYTEPHLKIDGTPDGLKIEVFFDPQTSGGLLISLPMERLDALQRGLQSGGALAMAVIGEVVPRREVALWLR